MKKAPSAADTARFVKVINAHFKKACKEPAEQLKFYLDPNNATVCYVLIHHVGGNEDEYMGGEYIVRMQFPANYPFEPPQFYFMTPNGLYGVETKVCISIGEFHKDEYRATLGLIGFAKQLISGMIGWREMGSGISLMKPTNASLIKAAGESQGYNAEKHTELLNNINSCFAEYSKSWKVDLEKIDPKERARLGL
jgi:ubiquitin-protein ligase